MLINFTEEGQSVSGPYAIPYLNNCLLEHVGVYVTVASSSRTQSPKRNERSLRCVGYQRKFLHTKDEDRVEGTRKTRQRVLESRTV